ncbi:beta-phosphoglucomutase [Chitinophaga filiformis]|uniref:Beta-phosphoglucomutase n=2 Tax=Chitinophaga filiformis TaxID=104663 RepID=A0A1G7NKZ8_CHIFI|nr:beta-phosphoglucomutase [Chitinophaga filiformis]
MANELGFNFTEAQNEKLKGVSRVRSLELILEWGGIEKSVAEQHELATRKNDWYVDMINHMTPEEILPGAKELLESLRSAGIKTALGSASKNAGVILDKVGILSLFDVVIDGNMVSASKPDPEVFLKGAEALGAAPEQCIVFEDAIAGVEAGKAGGMKVVGIGEKSVLNEADLVVSGLQEINIQTLTNLYNSK